MEYESLILITTRAAYSTANIRPFSESVGGVLVGTSSLVLIFCSNPPLGVMSIANVFDLMDLRSDFFLHIKKKSVKQSPAQKSLSAFTYLSFPV
jgi:hypothetical protein